MENDTFGMNFRCVFILIINFVVISFSSNLMAGSGSCLARGERELAAYRQSALFVIIDKEKYTLRESMVLDVGIRNDGDSSIFLYKNVAWGYGGGFVLHIKNQAGMEVAPIMRDDTMLPPPASFNDSNIFVEVAPDNFFGARRVLRLSNIIKNPGRYTVQVEYNNPLSCSIMSIELRRLPVLWHEDKSLVSNKVSFEVTQ